MIGYYLYNNHILTIDVDDYYFKPMINSSTAKYRSRHFKVLRIKTLNGEEIKKLDNYISLKFYSQEVDYFWSEQQILDCLPKENGYCRFYYDSGKLKERYFIKDGVIVNDTHHKYDI